ncbi:patatin-like phospholipase family protein [Knoellia koreensis]|uniref:Patatin-like phospholipase family protein n=1 Tax=Knoellia koreensis TaxID=2730921 RepID=A0A849HDF6_9MICO|nr:patatin-like phospholipase family protein [Knoellia sp. DB2414S]NNM45448.1 patatin-like phospholipase family protein [Knoellia sp. DB2414S]
MNSDPLSHNHSRALVLAGGGAAGNAWQIGLIAGLFEAGLDVTSADVIIGTSAGSTVAAAVTSHLTPSELYAAVLTEPRRPAPEGPTATTRPRSPQPSGPAYLDWSNAVIATATDPADMRRRMGAAALERDTSGGADAVRWREVVAARLPSHDWPEQRILITAVDAHTGEPVVFDRDSGVELVDAVAASTSAMTPYRIGGRRYLNGGYRRSENADLAAGSDRVLVLSPFGGRSRMPDDWGMDLATQVAELEAGGSRVATVFPDARAGDVFDANALDPATRGRAARGGYDQGRELAAGSVGELWR